MKYGTFLKVNKRFQTSVNLEYDLNRFDKLKSYIPTEQSVKILDAFLRSVYYTNEGHRRATVLIGPYGRGKSHLLLVLIALTSLDVFFEGSDQLEEARTIQLELIEKISTVDANVGELARSILESGTRLLPLIINSNTNDINQAFIIALRDSLEIAGLQSLLPETYFDTAYAVITKWETSIPSAYKKLSQEIRKHKRTVEDLRIGLKQFNQESYQLFCQCYPQIAAGAEFNPLMNMDVIKLYLSVTNALHEQTRFSGIHIVFDEFSKFLEANLDKSRMLNFKIIQDTAEAATRSGEQQFHFTCITHKDILDYSSSDSFKTVEGRFQKVRFVASSEQSYELIANAIEKTEEFDGFVKKYQKDFTKAIDYTSAVNVFGDLNEAAFMKKLIYGCFPLSPLSSFSLLRVSELVGQNERTLFTFIARNDEHTLARFIQKDYPTVTFLMMDTIFDYFEELFKKEMFNTSVHSIWAKTDSAIRQVSDSTQMKILKAIAIIKMIADDRLKAIPAHIKAALMMDDQDFDKAVKVLLKKYILTQRDTNELVLLTSNGVDIQKSITGLVKSKVSRIHICDVLSGAVELGFVLPREYNDHYSMLRYFKKVFVEAKDFLLFKNTDQILSNYPYDGLLIYIIQSNDSLNQEIQDKIQSYKGYPQIILCMSRKPFVYEELLKKLVAIQMLKDSFDTQLDSHYLEEVEIIEEDIQKQIQNGINEMFEPSSPYSYFQNCDGLFEVISRQVELNREISNICSRCYHLTPIINNEMVNKNVITSPIIKARDTVINWILDHADANAIPCMDGYGPEVSIFKSVFNRTGLNRAVTIEDPGMNVVLEQIGRFIAGCESKRSDFSGIYQTLTSKPYGLRKGIIPLLFAYMLRQYKENAVFYFSGKEVELSASILSNLNNAPESYELLIDTGTAEREKFLDQLEELFADFRDERTSSINRTYRVVKSMQNWIRSLPNYTKKFTTYLKDDKQKEILPATAFIRRELLKFEINSRELLFDTFVKKLGEDNNGIVGCYQQIYHTKQTLGGHLSDVRQELSKVLIGIFKPGYQGGLSRSIKAWYKDLPAITKTRVFDSNSNILLSFAEKLNSYDDIQVLDELIYRFTSMAIEDWSDALAAQFIDDISASVSKVLSYHQQDHFVQNDDCKIIINLENGNIEKSFVSSKISALGKTALNNLEAVFEEYNGALEPDEQLNILIQMIKDLLE